MVVSDGQRLGALALLVLCLFHYGLSLFHARYPHPAPPIPWGRQEPGGMAIEVVGNGAAGVYFMPKGFPSDQIFKAAGLPVQSEISAVSAADISDGVLLTLSPTGEVTRGEMAAAKRLALGIRVDLNRASESDLSLVPGIGVRMAARIVQQRLEKGGFLDLADLLAVPGIKEKRLNGLKDYLVVGRAKGVTTP